VALVGKKMSKDQLKGQARQAFSGYFSNVGTLAVAAISFGLALALTGGLTSPNTLAVSSLTSPSINLTALVQEFIAGILYVVGIFLAFIKQEFGVSFAAIFDNAKDIAIGGLLLTIGTTLLGLASTTTQPTAAILDILGGVFVLLGTYLGGTLALSVSSQIAASAKE
jgi:hypothetical protein